MVQGMVPPVLRRRELLLAAAAAVLPFGAAATPVCTPRELAQRYRTRVDRSLQVPGSEAAIYALLAESELADAPRILRGPQYLLVVDRCRTVQVAFLFWRLLPARYELIGASPVGVRTRASAASGVFDFGRDSSPVLLPPSLLAFLGEYGVLDAGAGSGLTPAGELLPFAGRFMVVLDSERGDRPDWLGA